MEKTSFFSIKQSYLPQISRLFSVRPLFWVIGGLVFGILASIFVFHKTPVFFDKRVLGVDQNKEHGNLEASYDYWKEVVRVRQDYRDGYIMLAWYSQQLGKTDELIEYTKKVKDMDPNYAIPEILQVEKSDGLDE
jgi:tetratricopeptide (TPR) repeat protein